MQNGEVAYVQASGRSYYDARFHESQTLAYMRMLEIAQMRLGSTSIQANEKWCSECNMVVNVRGFSPKAGTHDGLHPHCKECRNEHARHLYALEREALGLPVRAYNRKQAREIEVDFGADVTEKAA